MRKNNWDKIRSCVAALFITLLIITGCGDNVALLPASDLSSPVASSVSSASSVLSTGAGTTLPDEGKPKREEISSSTETSGETGDSENNENTGNETFDLSQIPYYTGSPYTVVNDNVPSIPENEYTTKTFVELSELDNLGRCGTAYGCFGPETVTDKERGAIGHIKPSGWHTVKYNGIVDGNYLYNRCHLIMYKLSGILDDNRNLITGTRYLNIKGMLPFEEQLTDYVEETENHVMYRVTPTFAGDDLVAHGVHMEAASVEDTKIRFNVFCYNIQPGVDINYATGESSLSEQSPVVTGPVDTGNESTVSSITVNESAAAQDTKDLKTYVVNKNTHKFHLPDCSSAAEMKPQNKKVVKNTKDDLINQGYDPCGICKP